MEIKLSDSPKVKVTRSVRLDPDLDDELLFVCKRLGVNVNAFLIQAVGECITKHMQQVRIENAAIEAMNMQFQKMGSMMEVLLEQQKDQ